MAGQTSIGQIAESDYTDLLQTLSATAKGRAFLAEHRRRGRPEDAEAMFSALNRIEAVVQRAREELKPDSMAAELQRIAMTLQLATEGTTPHPMGDETARRMALVTRARLELVMLAGSLGT